MSVHTNSIEALNRILDRLDVENDDSIRADLIDEAIGLSDRNVDCAPDLGGVPMSDLPEYKNCIRAAHAYADAKGIVGRPGGWLYNAKGTPLVQGWAAFAGQLMRTGVIRDIDGQSLATRDNDMLNGRLRRNGFDGHPVLLSLEPAPSAMSLEVTR